MTTATLAAPKSAAPPAPARSPNFLKGERALLERYLPGLDAALKAVPLATFEGRESPGLKMLKAARGPALLIPKQYGGLGATASEGMRVLRAIASRAPSLGIAFTMHSFSVCTLVEWAMFGEEYGEMILSSLAENSLYVASGFAEGRSGAKPLDMTMRARRAPDGGWLLTGKKKPCSLTYSMDFLSCGVSAEVADGSWQRAVGLVPADAPGIERRPFWKSHVLAGAESDEVILNDVHVPADFVFVVPDSAVLDQVEVAGFIWFQMALASTYLGVVSGLAERLVMTDKGLPEERGLVLAQLEGYAAAIDGIAAGLADRTNREHLLARALSMRFAVQTAIEGVAMKCAELLGGMAFMGSPEVAYLLCASRAMAFHPPGRLQATRALDSYSRGGPLDLI
jgi:alkylation response protein AidB-like acyl-CoA dehydrogenase